MPDIRHMALMSSLAGSASHLAAFSTVKGNFSMLMLLTVVFWRSFDGGLEYFHERFVDDGHGRSHSCVLDSVHSVRARNDLVQRHRFQLLIALRADGVTAGDDGGLLHCKIEGRGAAPADKQVLH
mmetsp:Transcript_41218/g.30302  ORF Transcript_41218/g.30302 Transcript_41218/m.30302 type:complete len:125 (-) Transcript_41218:68-442(-)